MSRKARASESQNIFFGNRDKGAFIREKLLHYGVAFLSVALALWATLLLNPYLTSTPAALFFGAVMVSAWYGGLGPGLLATVLSTFAVNYFFFKPLHPQNITNPNIVVPLIVFMLTAGLISWLNESRRTAQRQAEANLKSLHESEARFGRLTESNIIGVIVANLNGLIVEANDAFLKMLNYTREDLCSGRIRWGEIVPLEYIEVSERAIQELTMTGSCKPFEQEYICKDGSLIPVLLGFAKQGDRTIIGFVLDLSERKQAQAEAQHRSRQAEEAQSILQMLLEQVPEGITIAGGPPDFPIIANSKLTQELLGRPNESLVGISCESYVQSYNLFLADGVTPLTLEQLPLYRATRYGETIHDEECIIERPDGTTITAIANVVPIRDSQGEIIGAIDCWRDITNRKLMEEALRQRETELRLITDTLPVLITFVDSEQRYRFNNRAYQEWFGHSTAEVYGKHLWEVLGKSAYEVLRPYVEQVLAGEQVTFESQVPYKDGGTRYINAIYVPQFNRQGIVEGYAALVTDISEQQAALRDRNLAEKALRDSEERYRILTEVSPQAIWMGDRDGGITYCNQYWLDYTGLTMEQTAGYGWIYVIHPNDRDRVLKTSMQAVANATDYEIEIRFRQVSDGSYRWHIVRGLPFRDPSGQITKWVGIASDIHDRKIAEAALQQLNEMLEQRIQERTIQLEAANKELESFSYSVSHDLRAPLRHIAGFVELLQKRHNSTTLDETSQRYLKIIADTAKQAGILIDELLTFSRMGRTEMRYINLNMEELVHEVKRDLIAETPGRTIHWHIESLLEVQGDPSMLRLVLRNLMGNAVKYSQTRNPAEITVGSIDNENEVIFFVQDNGVGFNMQYVHKLFGVFQRLHSDPQFEGTGVGLANVQRIIHRHNGRVWAEAVVDSGSTFYFSLPKLSKKESDERTQANSAN
ncbi:MAG: PAS domain S-box protein [Nostoc sp. DedQUE12b]|uniref:PAS domain S-box protein n=1 Tax=Nostoc sp. DedQUE12b TaxID=3075398 RepID=UPI002AD3F450|nr:PAS domain S-box protein [Nostoc sp. DedQUE12b]MDZ8088476.1 PAS domain S-box protein [Nostoc sp. DedQUE12b]